MRPKRRGCSPDWGKPVGAAFGGGRCQKPAQTPCLPGLAPAVTPAPRWEQVDVRGVRVEAQPGLGEVYLGLALWRGSSSMSCCGLAARRAGRRWSGAGGRFADDRTVLRPAPRNWASRSTGMKRPRWTILLGVAPERVNDDRLYRALDELGEHKDALCAHLMSATGSGSAYASSFSAL